MSKKRQTKRWNPRFRFYARTQGRTPQQQLDHDREEYPGGAMVGFICWLRETYSNYAMTCRLVHVPGLQGSPGSGWSYRETSEEGFAAYLRKTYPKIRIAW